jgi:hypothetical protein
MASTDPGQPQQDEFENKAMAALLLRALGSDKLLEQEHEGCTPLGRVSTTFLHQPPHSCFNRERTHTRVPQ